MKMMGQQMKIKCHTNLTWLVRKRNCLMVRQC